MADLRIVYVPESTDFMVEYGPYPSKRYVGDPKVDAHRRNFQALRETVPDLPERVGVITIDRPFKNFSRRARKDVTQYPCFDGKEVSYFPGLDVLKESLALRELDYQTNPLSANLVYRFLMLHMICTFLSLDTIYHDDSHLPTLLYASALPGFDTVKKLVKGLRETMQASDLELPKTAETTRDFEKLLDEIGSWNGLERMLQDYQQRFDLHRVSGDFPLFAMPRSTFPAYSYTVELTDKVEVPAHVDNIMPYLEAGAKAGGLDGVPDDIIKGLHEFDSDLFARTDKANNPDELIRSLPSPITILTDIYLFDSFPGLANRDFETIEFRQK